LLAYHCYLFSSQTRRMYFSGILRFLFLFCVSISVGTAVANTASFSNYVKITVPDSFEISEDATIRKLQWFANYRFCAVPQNQDYIQGMDPILFNPTKNTNGIQKIKLILNCFFREFRLSF
jgi:hypothetical protein